MIILEFFAIVFLILFVMCIYFLPTIIAGSRETYNEKWVLLVNLILGWMPIIWFTLFIMSMLCGRNKTNQVADWQLE